MVMLVVPKTAVIVTIIITAINVQINMPGPMEMAIGLLGLRIYKKAQLVIRRL